MKFFKSKKRFKFMIGPMNKHLARSTILTHLPIDVRRKMMRMIYDQLPTMAKNEILEAIDR
jgi:hypothetical protein